MAKRFTDTNKWNKEWFMGLSAEGKLLWIYLCDQCDHAGVWDKNLRLASFHLGFEVTQDSLAQFSGRLVDIGDGKVWLSGFIEFQYGELSQENNAHKGVIARLKRFGIDPQNPASGSQAAAKLEPGLGAPKEPLNSPSGGAQDKEKDKESLRKGGVGEKQKAPGKLDYPPEFESVWRRYPRHDDKKAAYEKFRTKVLGPGRLDEFNQALDVYLAEIKRNRTEIGFVKYLKTFLGNWEEKLTQEHSTPSQKADPGFDIFSDPGPEELKRRKVEQITHQLGIFRRANAPIPDILRREADEFGVPCE